MNQIMKKIVISFVSMTMFMGVTPIYAEDENDEISKEESVYAVLNADGSVKEITVSDTLHSDHGFSNYEDQSNLKNVENLKSDEEVKSYTNGYIWTSEAHDIYYQGTSDEQLPLEVSMTYTLDGKEVNASDIIGKSGHIVMKLHVDNTSENTYQLNEKTYTLVTPFVVAAGTMLDMDHFSNVTIDNGMIESDSSHIIVGSAFIPGLKQGLTQIMSENLVNQLDDYLFDDMVIEADTDAFISPNYMLVASVDTDEIKEEFNDFDDFDIESISNQLDQLQDATNQLVTGTKDLYDGATQLNEGVQTALDGSQQLKSGAEKINSGASELSDGANQLSGGTQSLVTGLQTLHNNSAQLNNGAKSVTDGVFQLVNSVLKTQGIPTVTRDNYASIFMGQFAITDEQIQIAKDTIQQIITSKTGADLSDDDLNTLLYYASTQGDLTVDNLSQASEVLQNAKVLQKQISDATLKANDAYEDPQTKIALDTIRQNIIQDDTNAYETVYPTIRQTIESSLSIQGVTLDDDLIDVVIATALENGGSLTNDTIQQAIYLVQNGKGSTTIGKENQYVIALCKQKASEISNETIYTNVMNTIMNQFGVDQSTAALLIAYSANYEEDGQVNLTSALSKAAVTLTNAQSLQTILANQNSEAGKNLVKSKLADVYLQSVTSNEDLKQLKTLLDGALALELGIEQYTDGVQVALDGAKTLQSGASSLASGVQTLSKATQQFSQGAQSFNTGMQTLKDGSQTLADGAKTLMDGMGKYNDEAISKLTQNGVISDLEEASALFKVMKNDENGYHNYSGISENTKGSVKFIYKIEGAKEEKVVKNITDKVQSEKTSFLERLLSLFHFGE